MWKTYAQNLWKSEHPKKRGSAIKLYLHTPGEMPDLFNVMSSFVHANPKVETFWDIKPLVTNSTNDFNDMAFEKRNCRLSNDDYAFVNCFMETEIREAVKECGCNMWYTGKGNNSCDLVGGFCFRGTKLLAFAYYTWLKIIFSLFVAELSVWTFSQKNAEIWLFALKLFIF